MRTTFVDGRASRRRFLRYGAAFAGAGIATPFALQLAGLGEASAQSAPGYRALVCVFLYGGNDHDNTVVPYDADSHASYAAVRGSIARGLPDLLPLAPDTPLGGRQVALPRELAPVATLFAAGQAAIVANVGTLVQPTTLAQYRAQSVPLPPKLFSHNDQQSFWQSSSPEGAQSGWGGRMGDLLQAGNGQAIFTCIASGSTDVLLAGRVSRQYAVTSTGSIPMNVLGTGTNNVGAAAGLMRTLMTETRAHHMEQELNRTHRRSIEADAELRAALAGVALTTPFPPTTLGGRLQVVARMIAARGPLAARRQVFFTSLGGFDNHDSLPEDQPALHAQVADAMAAFHAATVELGIADQVTLFTASDFGRTMTSNGDGSDHGWGGHHFVVGGAVRGRAIYGELPEPRLGHAADVGNGRLLPAVGVDQYAATLGGWLGLSATQLTDVLPGLSGFSTRDLGFLG